MPEYPTIAPNTGMLQQALTTELTSPKRKEASKTLKPNVGDRRV
jgi:hypothetical protein